MSQTVNVHEAKTHFSKLLEQAHQGEEIIVAKAGKPYARLMPLADAPRPRRLGWLAGRVGDAFFEPEMERQPAMDTTRDGDKPMGRRGAYIADNLPPESG
jgi:prevent-host-death family protein